jgi:integrase/recombinase XerD
MLQGRKTPVPHALRHTFATTALAKGMDIKEVQGLLGHERLATTLIYLKAQPNGLVEKYRRVMEGDATPAAG